MIKELKSSDISQIKELEESFESVLKHASILQDFKSNPFTHYLVIEQNGEMIGFLNYTLAYQKMEIININVKEAYQNQKVASQLMEYLIDQATQNNVENITLEVKETNLKAIHLYQKYGFRNVAIRKGYYQGIDGILMEKEVKK